MSVRNLEPEDDQNVEQLKYEYDNENEDNSLTYINNNSSSQMSIKQSLSVITS